MHHLLLANGPLGEHGTKPFNIGRGLASHLWVVEPQDHDKLTPIGCAGELLIEGPLVTLG